jgi:catechol 2,3-dioxygenase-like lactoylglutathione lyase family enzyme
MTYPRNFSHIGITVTDLDKAVEFYTKVMGWYLIMPATTTEDDSAIGVMCNDVFGPGQLFPHRSSLHRRQDRHRAVRVPQQRAARKQLRILKTGVFHFSVQDPDVEGLARIVAAGGKQRMPVREYYPGEKPYRMVYMEDPSATSSRSTATYELTYPPVPIRGK